MVKKSKDKNNKLVNKICKDCWRWTMFEDKCHYYWEHKKECSQFMSNEESEPEYIKEEKE